ncbi:MAG: hypothetical protein COU10_01635 [Candidatus Harrisonbacteria bacterium CG10_big_fil_rev_8_21_14_0_10_45_28]|uniref:ATP-grasp domain-containing protein n=1 Tax=Candidatus Harrisonbacteria bacterium CG10_big_fil_rev_8_21_14_0_10_45_28 TaxID=1974586 RepID=A0A2H0UNP0_9BACT|nr:MAG: hypothetical protein COU10_01635 [Candidatus Harrisonbacteria bacterium CG10_big_fil_rev_8_21_14_0_10_45_28]
MKKAILVLTNSEDGAHSKVVIAKLISRGERVFRMDSDRLATGAVKVRFSVNQEGVEFIFKDGRDRLASDEIKSVWYRRPNHFNLGIHDSVQKAYAERELSALLEGLWAVAPEDIFWVSNPRALENARKKIAQIKLARSMNLHVPQTIISNDPEEIRSFYEACNGRIVFKAIYHEHLDYGTHSFNVPTTMITSAHLKRLDLIRTAPGFFQEFVERACELRITAVQDQLFPVRVAPHTGDITAVDWRDPHLEENLTHTLVEIPAGIAEICRSMLRKLDLAFGAFDFLVDKEGEIYFLEVNPNGQWYWLEAKTGVLISDAIADSLTTERR